MEWHPEDQEEEINAGKKARPVSDQLTGMN